MKPYINLTGKAKWQYFWCGKVKRKFKTVFKKSARQESNQSLRNSLMI